MSCRAFKGLGEGGRDCAPASARETDVLGEESVAMPTVSFPAPSSLLPGPGRRGWRGGCDNPDARCSQDTVNSWVSLVMNTEQPQGQETGPMHRPLTEHSEFTTPAWSGLSVCCPSWQTSRARGTEQGCSPGIPGPHRAKPRPGPRTQQVREPAACGSKLCWAGPGEPRAALQGRACSSAARRAARTGHLGQPGHHSPSLPSSPGSRRVLAVGGWLWLGL